MDNLVASDGTNTQLLSARPLHTFARKQHRSLPWYVDALRFLLQFWLWECSWNQSLSDRFYLRPCSKLEERLSHMRRPGDCSC